MKESVGVASWLNWFSMHCIQQAITTGKRALSTKEKNKLHG
jgi:hypothetical protein